MSKHTHSIILDDANSWSPYDPKRLTRLSHNEQQFRGHVSHAHKASHLFTVHTDLERLHEWHERRHSEWDREPDTN